MSGGTGQGGSAAAAEYRAGDSARLQALVDGWSSAGSWAYWAFADTQGRYCAHTLRQCVGQQVVEPSGATVEWGEVRRVRFVASDSRVLREYRTPVRAQGGTVGTLYLAVAEPSLWGMLRSLAEYTPAAVLGPLLLMSIGVFVLRRAVGPMTQIEQQLHRCAHADTAAEVELREVPAVSPAASGWNRLVAQCSAGRQRGGLETRLAEALEGFRQRKADQILNSLPEGIALGDAQGRITLANHALATLMETEAGSESLSGRTMEEVLGLDADSPGGRTLADPDARSRTVVVEIARSGDASQGVLRVARHPLRGAKGMPATGHVWSVRDVTQQKLAEQMRNQFVNSATHELRTPLANIKAYAETLVLSEMLDVEKQKQFCNTINAEATRLARFIDDLLSISSMEVGSLSLARQETDIERLLREVQEKARPQMAQKKIVLRCALPEKLPKLRIDKDKIVATLVNLLGNAAKYTPEGGQVDFKVQVKSDALQIDVEDTGIGIAAEELPRIFEKFFRSSDPRVQQETGSGLGLSLAQEVVRLHGGKLTVQSELNKGSRFTVALPL